MNRMNKTYLHLAVIFVVNFLLGILPIPHLFDSIEKGQLFVYFSSIALISTLISVAYWYFIQKLILKFNRISQSNLIESFYTIALYLFGFSFFISTQKFINFDPMYLAIVLNLIPWFIFMYYNKSISSLDDFFHSLFKFAIPHFVLHQILFAVLTLVVALIATGYTQNFQ